ILGTDSVSEPLPADANSPADLAPICAGVAEFLRLGAFTAISADDPERGDARIAEREDDVTGSHLSHELVEGVAMPVLIALGRPQIAALDFLAEGLVLVDPPVTHVL